MAYWVFVAAVVYHPTFVRQLRELNVVAVAEDRYMELLGDVVALVRALEEHGHHIEGYQPGDASHPIVTSAVRVVRAASNPADRLHTVRRQSASAEDPLCLVRCWGRRW